MSRRGPSNYELLEAALRADRARARAEREIAEEHAAADARCGRDWTTEQGCGCSACRTVRARQA